MSRRVDMKCRYFEVGWETGVGLNRAFRTWVEIDLFPLEGNATRPEGQIEMSCL